MLLLAIQLSLLSAGEPEIVKQESTYVEAWSATIIQKYHGPKDSDAILLDLSLVDKNGVSRLLAKNIVGPIVLFEEEKKIFCCEDQGAIVGIKPLIIDLNGGMIKGPKHPGDLRQYNRIEHSNLLLLLYTLVKDGKPYSLIRIFDTDGKIVLEKDSYTEEEIVVSYEGKMYKVGIPQPDWPG